MRQLNLFGEEAPPEKKDVSVLKEDEAAGVRPENIAPTAIERDAENLKAHQRKDDNTLIFEDSNIAVKIKYRKQEVSPTLNEPDVFLDEDVKEPQEQDIVSKRGRTPLNIPFNISDVQIPDDEELFSKRYYPISTVAKWFNVNASLIRYWETEFSALKPRKNKKGDRLFRPEDVKTLMTIYYLLRQKKYTIEGAKTYLKNNKEQAEDNLMLIETLKEIRNFFTDLKFNLE